MNERCVIRAAAWCLGVLLSLPIGIDVLAQAQEATPSGHVLRAADYDAHTIVPATRPAAGKTLRPSVAITVSYHGFSPQAQQAFEYAVSLWEEHLTSPVTVHVDATFEPLEEDVLGSAGPRLTANFAAAAVPNTWYPTAVADAITGRNVDTGSADIVASFNSEFENWYFGIDGRPPTGQYDFVTVVLHEIGHGLGFTGSFDVEDANDDVDECPTDELGVGCWGLETASGRQRYPLIYDRFVEDVQETPLLDTRVYPNPSQKLGTILQGGSVFFDGESVRFVNEDIPVDLYAPASFERGSSFSHLDEQTFPPGDPNSLMTPFLGRAEVVHSPGAVTCAILQDLGWPMGDGCLALFFAGISTATGEVVGNTAVVTFQVSARSGIDSVVVEIAGFGAPLERVAVVDVNETAIDLQKYEVEIDDLQPGRYTVRLRLVGVDTAITPGPELTIVIPLEQPFLAGRPFPNPTRSDVNLLLMVREVQTVRAEVFDALGRRQATLFAGRMNQNEELRLSADVRNWAPGVYFILIRGEDFALTERFVRIR